MHGSTSGDTNPVRIPVSTPSTLVVVPANRHWPNGGVGVVTLAKPDASGRTPVFVQAIVLGLGALQGCTLVYTGPYDNDGAKWSRQTDPAISPRVPGSQSV